MPDADPLPAPTLEVEPHTGRPILMAPQRRHRPHLTGTGAPAARRCPFCPGHEADTPAELDAVRAPGTARDTPGWRVRLFPNLYPAAALHWVVAEGNLHAEQPAELDAGLWQDALALYQRACTRILAQNLIPFWFKNVGARAGASIAHNHSQILGLPMLPPRLEQILARASARSGCAVCDELLHAEREQRLVYAADGFAVFCPRHPKLPHETWLAPWAHGHAFTSGDGNAALARALQHLFTAVARALDTPPHNVWLHDAPDHALHWHLELQPRTGNLAGLELGGDMYINSIPGVESAARLRSVLGERA